MHGSYQEIDTHNRKKPVENELSDMTPHIWNKHSKFDFPSAKINAIFALETLSAANEPSSLLDNIPASVF